jgi:hypothetical protein
MSTPKSYIWIAAALLLSACAKPAPEPLLKATPAETKPGTTLTAAPDPIVAEDGGTLGETTINWSTTAAHTEVHLDAPDGKLFVRGGAVGTAKTAKWVNNGMTFYLQDTDNPNPGSPEATLGKLVMVVQ